MIVPTWTKIIDYTHADYIPIYDGDIILWDDYGYIKHAANLTNFEDAINETNNLVDIFPKTHMKKILQNDVVQMETLLTTLRTHHRQARSLNFLGTALKIIAGTPDFDDFNEVKFQQENLIESNNRHILINSKINKLTDTVNLIISVKKNCSKLIRKNCMKQCLRGIE